MCERGVLKTRRTWGGPWRTAPHSNEDAQRRWSPAASSGGLNEKLPMPLLCIRLLALLLLPLSLSCGSQRPPEEVRGHYQVIVRTHLDRARDNITDSLYNSSCSELKHKLRNCAPNITTIVNSLHSIICRMDKLQLAHTKRLVSTVLRTIQCPCRKRPTPEPDTVTRRKRDEHSKSRETKKLCRANAMLSAVAECYEILNALQM